MTRNVQAAVSGVLRFCVLLGIIGFYFLLVAAESAPPREHRWLLIIETSSQMQSRSEGTFGALQVMLQSEMAGQLQPGDSIGLWTFDRVLRTGVFPLQRWTEDSKAQVASKILKFVQNQGYQGKGELTRVMPALSGIISNSPAITVILIGSGEGTFAGTELDSEINAEWARLRAEQQKLRSPIVTLVRAQEGKTTAYTVSPGQFAVDFPPMPKPIAPLAAKEPSPSPNREEVEERKPVYAKPLILSGKKTTGASNESHVPVPSQPETAPGPEPSIITNVETNPRPATAQAPPAEAIAPDSKEAPHKDEPLVQALSPSVDPGTSKVNSEDRSRAVRPWWIAIAVLAVIVVAGCLFWLRKRPKHVSLITESLDREQ